MIQTYATRRTAERETSRKPQERTAGPELAALAAGAAPTPPQMGRQVDLPGGIREKMENSFGADFSKVKLYESDTVADAGAQAVTRGSDIAFAPGKLDLASTDGQALLGHELSHVVSQARGESTGQGFLNDSRLEAQADRQGMLAAQGQSVYSGPVSPIGASTAVSATGPMQAKKPKKDAKPEAAPEAAPAPQKRTDMTPQYVTRGLSDLGAQTLAQRLQTGDDADIADSEIFDDVFMSKVGIEAGKAANAAMEEKRTENWAEMSTAGFRSSHTGYQQLLNAIAYRKLQGGKDENGQHRHLMTDALSANAADAASNVKAVRERMEGDEGFMSMIGAYAGTAFTGHAGNVFTPAQQSAMLMQNLNTGMIANMVGEDRQRGDSNRELTNKGKVLQSALMVNGAGEATSETAKNEADAMLGLLTESLTPMTLEELEASEKSEDGYIDLDIEPDEDGFINIDDL